MTSYSMMEKKTLAKKLQNERQLTWFAALDLADRMLRLRDAEKWLKTLRSEQHRYPEPERLAYWEKVVRGLRAEVA